MNYMWKFMSNFTEFYKEINSATLTGAIDVIVVQQEDGSFTSSPFHVRFGKIGVLRSREKVVDIEINGEPVDIHMKLGESGEAFFVEETDDPSDVPSYLVTSPIPPDICEEGALPSVDLSSATSLEKCQGEMGHSGPMVKSFSAEEVRDVHLADDAKFQPIALSEVSVAVQTELEATGLVEDEKGKVKKKRKRKGHPRKKWREAGAVALPGPEALEESCDVADSATADSGYKDSVSSMEDVGESRVFEDEDDEEEEDIPVVLLGEYAENSKRAWRLGSMEFTDNPLDFQTTPPSTSRPTTPKSDTEYEIRKMEAASQTEEDHNHWSWTWGELPMPPKSLDRLPMELLSDDEGSSNVKIAKKEQDKRSMLGAMLNLVRARKKQGLPEPEGIYLDELNPNDLEPEVAALYLSSNSMLANVKTSQTVDEDAESGNGSSLPHSPHSVEGAIGGPRSIDSDNEDRTATDFKDILDISLSLCGGFQGAGADISPEKFAASIVTHQSFSENPGLLTNPELVVRIGNKYYNWQVASPMVLSWMAFQRPLNGAVVDKLVAEHMPKKMQKPGTRTYSWFSWRRGNAVKESIEQKSKKSKIEGSSESKDSVAIMGDVDLSSQPVPPDSNGDAMSALREDFSQEMSVGNVQPNVESLKDDVHPNGTTSSEGESSAEELHMGLEKPKEKRVYLQGTEKYKKSLRLTSDQISQLNLKEGPNEVVFSVTTAYQGTTRCKCHMYLWKYDDHVIISDIDGTITKSDVLGHILPIIGKPWAQSGVAQLFTKIKENGYQFLYLSARAIGQARVTRDYLRSVRQDDVCLPDGPLLLSPSSLISALHREVIEKKPEEFKIECLRDIHALFPLTRNPFYAGYGNKINDVFAYRAMGIPMSRIFTINHKGELKHDLTQTFQSSYSGLSHLVDHLFPPLRRSPKSQHKLRSDFLGAEEFSSFTYWRVALPDVPLVFESKNDSQLEDKK